MRYNPPSPLQFRTYIARIVRTLRRQEGSFGSFGRETRAVGENKKSAAGDDVGAWVAAHREDFLYGIGAL